MTTIRMFDENRDVDDFLELFRISYGKPMSKICFEWKYMKNPFRINIHPIVVAAENNRLIGARAVLFSSMMVKGTIFYTTQGTDGMVHPAFRRRGINLELRRFCQELYRESQYKLHYGFPNEMSVGNNLRTGGQPIYKTISHWKVLNPYEVFYAAFQNPILRKSGVVLSPFLRHKTGVPKVRNQNVTVKEVGDMVILEDVYNRWKNVNKIYTTRDAQYLNWRFKSHPEKEYHFLVANVGPEVKGYFVINQGDFRGMRRGTIVDYLVVDDDPNIFESLLNYSLNMFKARNCALVDTWVFTQKWAQPVVEDYGFISSRNVFIRRRFPDSYFLASLWSEQNFPYDIYSTEWYITPSDWDIY